MPSCCCDISQRTCSKHPLYWLFLMPHKTTSYPLHSSILFYHILHSRKTPRSYISFLASFDPVSSCVSSKRGTLVVLVSSVITSFTDTSFCASAISFSISCLISETLSVFLRTVSRIT